MMSVGVRGGKGGREGGRKERREGKKEGGEEGGKKERLRICSLGVVKNIYQIW